MFTIEYVKDLVWDSFEHNSFSCVAKYAEFNEEHPTGVSADDPYGHIQEIWQNGISGVYGPIKEYDPWKGAKEYSPENLHIPVTVIGETL